MSLTNLQTPTTHTTVMRTTRGGPLRNYRGLASGLSESQTWHQEVNAEPSASSSAPAALPARQENGGFGGW